jgi:hypothetical protein
MAATNEMEWLSAASAFAGLSSGRSRAARTCDVFVGRPDRRNSDTVASVPMPAIRAGTEPGTECSVRTRAMPGVGRPAGREAACAYSCAYLRSDSTFETRLSSVVSMSNATPAVPYT